MTARWPLVCVATRRGGHPEPLPGLAVVTLRAAGLVTIFPLFMPPSILALHYWAGSGREFHALRPLLPPGALLLAPDLPGFNGQAVPPGFDFSMDAYADWVAAYAHARQLTDFVLLGHSMGGKIALALAARQPVGLRRLVLLAPSPPGGEPIADRPALLAGFGKPREAEKTFHNITERPLSSAEHQRVVADSLRCSHAAWDAWVNTGSREDIAGRMPALAVPCQVLMGLADRAIAPAIQRRLTLPTLPAGTTHTELAGVGHLLPLEAPQAVVQALRE